MTAPHPEPSVGRHTPGPWRVHYNGSYGPFVDACDALDPDYGAAAHDVGHETHSVCVPAGPNAHANARLIAASPELAALAQRVAEHFENTDAPLGIEARRILASLS